MPLKLMNIINGYSIGLMMTMITTVMDIIDHYLRSSLVMLKFYRTKPSLMLRGRT